MELQSAARDLQDAAKVEKDKMRKWTKMAEEARTHLAAVSPPGQHTPCLAQGIKGNTTRCSLPVWQHTPPAGIVLDDLHRVGSSSSPVQSLAMLLWCRSR